MKKKIFKVLYGITLIIGILLVCSCSKEERNLPLPDGLYGYWANPSYNDTLITYARTNKMPSDSYGFSFQPGGKFLERKNIGWCGTPPIVYIDYEGEWSIKDSVIYIRSPHWGGTMEFKWQLLSVNNKFLNIRQLN